MENIVTVMSFFLCVQISVCAANCDSNCNDQNLYCPLFAKRCDQLATKLMCQRTCQVCKICPSGVATRTANAAYAVKTEYVDCEKEPCVDNFHPLLCQRLKQHSYGCMLNGNNCRKTCKVCECMKLPPTPKPCSQTCEDKHEACEGWKKDGYCNPKKGYPHTANVCELSCKTCTLCPTKKPNTALQPLPKTTSKTN